jgi:hypothetical protein
LTDATEEPQWREKLQFLESGSEMSLLSNNDLLETLPVRGAICSPLFLQGPMRSSKRTYPKYLRLPLY